MIILGLGSAILKYDNENLFHCGSSVIRPTVKLSINLSSKTSFLDIVDQLSLNENGSGSLASTPPVDNIDAYYQIFFGAAEGISSKH